MSLLELKSPRDGDSITAEAATEGSVTYQLPLTRRGWGAAESAVCGSDVILTSADGSTFLGTVQDTDEDRCRLYIELR